MDWTGLHFGKGGGRVGGGGRADFVLVPPALSDEPARASKSQGSARGLVSQDYVKGKSGL